MDEKTASSLIGRVRADDLERARTAIGNGVQCAEDQWIESGLIADALASELIKVALASQSGTKIAADLRALAQVVESEYLSH